MSWLSSGSGYPYALEKAGVGRDDAERNAIASRLFERRRSAFVRILENNPQTLFVAVAGNSNSDNSFDQIYPSSIVAPNLVVVNAVDHAGKETGFTSYGANVALSASGDKVVSLMPGGRTVARSGTSMAAPAVANLAAKLLALEPRLTPTEVIALMKSAATESPDGRLHLINPKASVALLK